MSEPSPFPEYFVNGLLRAAQWPRETGRFKKRWMVDTRMVDMVCLQLTELSVTLGALRPRLAAQLLADIFRERDWLAMPLAELLVDLDPSARVDATPDVRPWHAISTVHVAQDMDFRHEELMEWDSLLKPDLRVQFSVSCASGLMWGLLHPERAVAAINENAARHNATMPEAKKSGLAVDPDFEVPAAEDAAVTAEEMLVTYEEERRPLIPLPPALAASPELRGRLALSSLDDVQRNAVLAFIRHCQFLIASQQLTMELYNDGLERAADSLAPGDELLLRSYGGVSSPELAAEFIIPALEQKVAILKAAQSTHEAAHASMAPPSSTYEASALLSEAIEIWLLRSRVQLESWIDWAEDPTLDLSSRMANLDDSETKATGIALQALNRLIETTGLSRPDFLEINRQAFNLVRARRQLPPLAETEFEHLYSSGLAGQRPRFFAD